MLRVDHGGEPSFEELLQRVREISVAAVAHQDLPLEILVEKLEPERSLSLTPLFQVMFSYQDAPVPALDLPGLEAEVFEVDTGTAKFDLSLDVKQNVDGCVLRWSYARDLFDASTIRRMDRHFQALLAAAVTTPEARLSSLPLQTPVERHQVLMEWSDTGSSPPGSQTLDGLFAEQAARRPGDVALVWDTQEVTYGELDRRSSVLALRLRAQGIEPEERVCVLTDRTPELVVALLAVLKSGATYVGLDASYPPERLSLLLEESRARRVITSGESARALPEDWQGERVEVTEDSPAGEAPSAVSASRPGSLAYLIYTSGSTGRPKGVAIEHRRAAVLVRWAAGAFSPEELSGVLASTSVCFDLSVFELFVPLCLGGTVVLSRDALELPRLPGRSRVRLINTVPSAMGELVRGDAVPAGVITVNLAGEPLPGSLVDALYERCGVQRVLNLYGPSEDTTYSTWGRMAAGVAPTIGRPVGWTQARVLDRWGAPVPVAVVGELYLGGAGLARGYLGRAGMTASRFVPDAFSGTPGTRLYRTGDLVRYRTSGELEFLGRTDHQVKVRGYRIELGEIEAALDACAEVRESVVTVGRDSSGSAVLVAYVAGADGPSDGQLTRLLRRRLGSHLPGYMVPTVWVELDALPRTPNGKVDRSALPSPPETSAEAEPNAAPNSPEEELLAGIWSEVLGCERAAVGPGTNFFELGGHSLLATRMTSRVRELFGVDLPVRRLFEHPDLSGFARCLVEARHGAASIELPPIEPISRSKVLPLSFAQERLWFLERLLPGLAAYNISAAVRLEGQLQPVALEWALREVAGRHETLRTTFHAVEGQPELALSPTLRLELPVVDLRAIPDSERSRFVQSLAGDSARRPFDLANGPLARFTLLRIGSSEHIVLLAMHHIISDGWSMGVLVRELSSLYDARISRLPTPLPDLEVQYADFAAWQRRLLTPEVLEEEGSYWRQRLEGAPAILDLPLDRPRPPRPTARGALVTSQLPQDLCQGIEALAQSVGATLFMTMASAFNALLQRWSGQVDLSLGFRWPIVIDPNSRALSAYLSTRWFCEPISATTRPSPTSLRGYAREVSRPTPTVSCLSSSW